MWHRSRAVGHVQGVGGLREQRHAEKRAFRRLSGSLLSGESKVSYICSVHLQVQPSAANTHSIQ